MKIYLVIFFCFTFFILFDILIILYCIALYKKEYNTIIAFVYTILYVSLHCCDIFHYFIICVGVPLVICLFTFDWSSIKKLMFPFFILLHLLVAAVIRFPGYLLLLRRLQVNLFWISVHGVSSMLQSDNHRLGFGDLCSNSVDVTYFMTRCTPILQWFF